MEVQGIGRSFYFNLQGDASNDKKTEQNITNIDQDFFDACILGDMRKLESLIENHKVNISFDMVKTCLLNACANNDFELSEFLIFNLCTTVTIQDNNGDTPLHLQYEIKIYNSSSFCFLLVLI